MNVTQFQEWTGWPTDSSDELSLAQMGITNEQDFTVARKANGGEDNRDGEAGPSVSFEFSL